MQKKKDSGTQRESAASTRELQAGFAQLEKREWWRWSAALIIMLLLTLGVISLSLPGLRHDTSISQDQLNLASRGLLALVIIFDLFAVYQQFSISAVRRDLANQIGILATLEAVKPPSPQELAGKRDLRRAPRFHFDQRLKVIAKTRDKDVVLHGRVIDISELGLGAVISGSLERGDMVVLDFSTGEGPAILRLSAVIRYARGFRHGFEFSGLSTTEAETLRRICATATEELTAAAIR